MPATKNTPAAPALSPDSDPVEVAPAPAPIFGRRLADGAILRLRLHAALAAMPGWEAGEEFTQLCESVAEHGVISPLLVHCTGEMDEASQSEWADVVDGRHRFSAALTTGLALPLPCAETETPVHEVVVRTLTERRHAGKGTRAYLVWPLIAPEIRGKGRPKKEIPEKSVFNLPDLAARYGFSVDTFDQARRLHEIFATRKDLRAELEPGILSGDIGLGAALAGIAGKTATEHTPREDAPHRILLERGFKALSTRFSPSKWDAMPDPDKASAANAAVVCVLAWPAEVQARLRLAL